MDKVYYKNPMNLSIYNTIFGLDDISFKYGIDAFLQYYQKILIKRNDIYYLPKGTLLYHGSLKYPFYAETINNKITFFGLDMDISMWYIYELLMKQIYIYNKYIHKNKKIFEKNGYMYVFKLTKDIPISMIIDKLHINPKDKRHCRKKMSVCLHPQVVYRGEQFNMKVGSKIHTELTLYFKQYKQSLKLIRIYLIDGFKLHKNHTNINYNTRNAIISEYNHSIHNDQLSYKDYAKLFLQNETFYCECGCGFEGTYQTVLNHEKTCPKCGTKQAMLQKMALLAGSSADIRGPEWMIGGNQVSYINKGKKQLSKKKNQTRKKIQTRKKYSDIKL